MPKLHHLAAVAAALVTLVFAAQAAATTVNVRVEGATRTIFEGPVDTTVHQIDPNDPNDNPDLHDCDGMNGTNPHNYSAPGPTVNGALDDAARTHGFTWSGTWDANYDDAFVHEIGGDGDSSSTFWNVVRNWSSLQNGGCQEQVDAGDQVLFALTGFDPNTFASWPLLELSGTPARAAVGEKFTVRVVQHDGTGSPATPAGGAAVGGSTTGGDGNAVVSFDSSGERLLKATRPSSIRSNGQTVCIYTPGSGECGTEQAPSAGGETPPSNGTPPPAPAVVVRDTTPPVVRVLSPVAGKKYKRGPRELKGQVDESGGIAQVFLRISETSGAPMGSSARRCRWFSGKRGVFTHRRVACSKARFFRIGSDANWSYLMPERLRHGRYVLEVKVLDKAYNAGRSTVPFGVK